MTAAVPTVMVVGQFPPPVNGMAVVTRALADRLEAGWAPVRVDLAVDRSRGPSYHARRLARVVRAVATLVTARRRSRVLLLACDGGGGMAYTAALAGWARLLRYRTWIHHHSRAHLEGRHRGMGALVRIAGPAVHVVLCDAVARQCRHHYPRARSVVVLSLGSMGGAPSAARSEPPRSGGFVVGHLGNLSLAKGLVEVIETVRLLRERGVDGRLVLAGPLAGAEEHRIVARALEAEDWVEHRGIVEGTDKDRFFAGLDAFCFPSRYRHELFPLVVVEALMAGVPVVALRAGCLDQDLIGSGGVVVDGEGDFTPEAARVLDSWAMDADVLAGARKGAADAAARLHGEGDETLDALVQTMAEAAG